MKTTMMLSCALVGLLAAACSHDAKEPQSPSTTSNTTTTASYTPPPAANTTQSMLDNNPGGAIANQDIQSPNVATTGVGDNGVNGSADTTGSNVTSPSGSYDTPMQQKFSQGSAALNEPQANAKPVQPAEPGKVANSGKAKSATDQGQSNSEVKTTAAIRKRMMASKTLSFGAKNVKVITQGDKVTLVGSVKSDAEKNEIEGIVKNTDGVNSVDDQLVVKQ